MLVVRSGLSARAISSTATTVVRAVDPALPIVRVSTLREALDNAVAERRFLLEHVVAFAGLALLLAAMGVYAVTSQVVRGRARELSIRTALGASASHLIWLAIRDALVVAGIGGSFGDTDLRALHTAARAISLSRQPMGFGNVSRRRPDPDSRGRQCRVCPGTPGRAHRSTRRIEVDVNEVTSSPRDEEQLYASLRGIVHDASASRLMISID